MTKNVINFLLGVLAGFVGMIVYTLMLNGFNYVTIYDVLNLAKDFAIPFIFTEACTAIFVEGMYGFKAEFISLNEKLNKKKSKKAEA